MFAEGIHIQPILVATPRGAETVNACSKRNDALVKPVESGKNYKCIMTQRKVFASFVNL